MTAKRLVSSVGTIAVLAIFTVALIFIFRPQPGEGTSPASVSQLFQSPLTLPETASPTPTPSPSPTVKKPTKTPEAKKTPWVIPVTTPLPPGIKPTTTWQPPQQSLSADVTADWPVYTDLDAGYSIKYPPDAYFHSGQDPRNRYKTVSIQLNVSGYGYQGMVIAVWENSDNFTLEQYLKNRSQEVTKQEGASAQYLSAVEEIKVGNLPALWSKADQRSDFFVATAHQDKIFVFAVSGPMAERVTGPETKDLAYKILSTFTILPQ